MRQLILTRQGVPVLFKNSSLVWCALQGYTLRTSGSSRSRYQAVCQVFISTLSSRMDAA